MSSEFQDSVEATDYVYDVLGSMSDMKLRRWVNTTDTNYSTECKAKLDKAITAYEEFLDELNSAA